MSFFEAVAACLSKYATFSGRASRAEFWWFMLFVLLAILIINAVASPFGGPQTGAGLVVLFMLAMVVPSFAVGARRLHDMGHSGWWQLLHISGLGTAILLVWMIFEGTPGANRFGQPVVPLLQE